MVRGRTSDTTACLSGINFGDRIYMYAVASSDTIDSSQLVGEKECTVVSGDFKKAHSANKSVILVIQRPGQISRV